MKAVFDLDPPAPGAALDFEPQPDLAARIRAGLEVHLSVENDTRPLHIRRMASFDAAASVEGGAA